MSRFLLCLLLAASTLAERDAAAFVERARRHFLDLLRIDTSSPPATRTAHWKLWSAWLRLGPVRVGRTLTYPEFALVCGDLRVKALRKKVGLPE